MTEAQKIATGGGSEQDVAEAKIELEVLLDKPPSCTASLLINVIGSGELASFLEMKSVQYQRLYKRVCGWIPHK